MDFYIQTGNPYTINKFNQEDSSLSEAIESVFPMNTEELILFWNHIGIPLSYKYDISYMINDIIILLQHIQSETEGELLVHWLPDTFRADWKLVWGEEMICIDAVWENLRGDLQKILADSRRIEISKKEFVSEWKMLLYIIISALKKSEYNQLLKHEYCKLVKNFNSIENYGILYSDLEEILYKINVL